MTYVVKYQQIYTHTHTKALVVRETSRKEKGKKKGIEREGGGKQTEK